MKLELESLIDQKFSKLTILGEVESHIEPNGKKQRVMLCKCDCENTTTKQLKELRNGNVKSCGCLQKGKILSLGKKKKFGSWVVTNSIVQKGKVTTKCICGKVSEISIKTLIDGTSKSCGCIYKALPKEDNRISIPKNTEDEKWEYFIEGRYMVSNKGKVFSIKTRHYMNVGKGKIVINGKIYDIRTVMYKSFVSDWDPKKYRLIDKIDNIGISLNNLFLSELTYNNQTWVGKALSNAKASKKEVSITKKDIIDLYLSQNGISYFLKLPLDLTGKDQLLGVSIDRIDNSKGYVKNNITLVTRFENMGRREAMFEEMLEFSSKYF